MKFAIVLVCALVAFAKANPTPVLAKQLAKGPADIIITFVSTSSTLKSLNSLNLKVREDRLNGVHNSLVALAEQSQKNVVAFLESKSIPSVQFWITNELFVKAADAQLVSELLRFKEIQGIRENGHLELEKPEVVVDVKRNNIFAEWGLENIQAHLVWNMTGGTIGTGVRVGSIDTGVRGTHEALVASFYGTYGWFDPYLNTTTPNDQNGHGTHTMGTICGSGGIGVAPGAQWQACKGCDTNECAEDALIRCAQWILCPTLPNGEDRECSHAPHLVSNSWGGGQGDAWYDAVIEAWHAGNVIPIFANGNSGSACNSANSPADSRAGVIAVGSTTANNDLSSFSSRGPSVFGDIKPDISAPGSSVRSSYITSDTSYVSLSGTSMACPHIAGVVALLKSLRPALDYASVSNLLYGTVDTNMVQTGQGCGGIVDSTYPNNAYGFGKVNAYKAAQAARASA